MDHAWLDPEAARSALGFPLVQFPPAATASPQAAIALLVAQARDTGALTEATALTALQSALRREQLASTAVGGGLALPHAKVEELSRQTGALGHAAAGVDWPSPDGERVRLVCLLLLWPRGGEMLRSLDSVRGYFLGRGHRVQTNPAEPVVAADRPRA
jgi:mannitol/fructose-specific phosphotransferase system IIA component (Ntr-type)